MPDDRADETLPARWSASTERPDLWMDANADPRFANQESTDQESADQAQHAEKANILDYLRVYRLTLEMKCADLDADQLARRSVPPSTMSLLGMVRHMADVERSWFRRVMAGADAPPLYWSDDVPDADWNGAVADPEVVAEAWRDWRDEVAFAETWVADAADLGMRGTMKNGEGVPLREVLVHMIEEYARHCGHADLLRERIDGRVGQ
jgi:uncharacterized damage-inducible protein DinB